MGVEIFERTQDTGATYRNSNYVLPDDTIDVSMIIKSGGGGGAGGSATRSGLLGYARYAMAGGGGGQSGTHCTVSFGSGVTVQVENPKPGWSGYFSYDFAGATLDITQGGYGHGSSGSTSEKVGIAVTASASTSNGSGASSITVSLIKYNVEDPISAVVGEYRTANLSMTIRIYGGSGGYSSSASSGTSIGDERTYPGGSRPKTSSGSIGYINLSIGENTYINQTLYLTSEYSNYFPNYSNQLNYGGGSGGGSAKGGDDQHECSGGSGGTGDYAGYGGSGGGAKSSKDTLEAYSGTHGGASYLKISVLRASQPKYRSGSSWYKPKYTAVFVPASTPGYIQAVPAYDIFVRVNNQWKRIGGEITPIIPQ